MPKPIILFIGAQKGGVGKSTSAYSIAAILSNLGVRTCLLDADPQANLTRSVVEYMLRSALKHPGTGKIYVSDKWMQLLFSKVEEVLLVFRNSNLESSPQDVVQTLATTLRQRHEEVAQNFTAQTSTQKLSTQHIQELREELTQEVNNALVDAILAAVAEKAQGLDGPEEALDEEEEQENANNQPHAAAVQQPAARDNEEEEENEENLRDIGIERLQHTLGTEGVERLKQALRQLMGSSNIVEALAWLSDTTDKEYLEQQGYRLAAGLLPVQSNFANLSEQTNLFLLPGHQNFFLQYNRTMGLAIEGLVSQGPFRDYVTKIRGINYLLRHLAEASNLDVIVIDSNPAAIEMNEVLLMTSDYFLMPLSPEPYSDHAALSMLSILQAWKKHFDYLYTQTAAARDGFPSISHPPKCLGFFFQKVPIVKGRVIEEIPKLIIKNVIEFYNERLCPFLQSQNMGGHVKFSPRTHIRKFDKDVKTLQIEGGAVVEGGKSKHKESLRARFTQLILNSFSLEKDNLPDNFKNAIEKLATAQEEEADFSETWIASFQTKFTSLNVADRISWLKSCKYFFDMYDFHLILDKIREEKLGSADCRVENNQAIFVADPFWIGKLNFTKTQKNRELKNKEFIYAQFPKKLKEDLRHVVLEWDETPQVIIIPFVQPSQVKTGAAINGENELYNSSASNEENVGLIWRCIRVEINVETLAIDILYDDPFGGVLSEKDIEKKTKVRPNLWDSQLQIIIHNFIVLLLRELFAQREKRGLRSNAIVLKHQAGRAKPHDQLGYPYNSSMSGLIVLSNINAYIPDEDDDVELLGFNSRVADVSKANLLTQLLKNVGMKDSVIRPVVRESSLDIKYQDLSKHFKETRRNKYREIIAHEFDFLLNEDLSWCEQRIEDYQTDEAFVREQERSLLAVVNLVKMGLNAVNLDDYYQNIAELYQELFSIHPEFLLDFVVALYEVTYLHRQTETKQGEYFANRSTEGALKQMKTIFSSHMRASQEENESATSPAEPAFPIGTSNAQANAANARTKPAATSAVLAGSSRRASQHVAVLEQRPYLQQTLAQFNGRLESIPGDGNCYFGAVAKAMEMAKLDFSLNGVDLRKRAATKVQSDATFHVGFGEDMELGTLEAYLNNMRRLGTYAVGPIIDALAVVLNIRIIIINVDEVNETAAILHINDIDPSPIRTICLCRTGYGEGAHYQVFVSNELEERQVAQRATDLNLGITKISRNNNEILLQCNDITKANAVLTQIHKALGTGQSEHIEIVVEAQEQSVELNITINQQQYEKLLATPASKSLALQIQRALPPAANNSQAGSRAAVGNNNAAHGGAGSSSAVRNLIRIVPPGSVKRVASSNPVSQEEDELESARKVIKTTIGQSTKK